MNSKSDATAIQRNQMGYQQPPSSPKSHHSPSCQRRSPNQCLSVIKEPKSLNDRQAEDDGLWFIAQTAPEAYLQQELRRLHRLIVGEEE